MSRFDSMRQAISDAGSTAASVQGSSVWLPDHWPTQKELLDNIQNMTPGVAAVLVLAGVVYLIFGYQIFKALVVVNAAVVGGYMGAIFGSKAGNNGVAGALVGSLLAAAVAWPTMKYAVAVMGGVFGAMLGASVWHLAKLDASFAWAGAGMGLIFCGMLSFMLFRGCVMAYTSAQGSVMLIFGILGLTFKYPAVANDLMKHFLDQRFLLPMAVFIPAILGVIYQQHNYPGQAGGGGKK